MGEVKTEQEPYKETPTKEKIRETARELAGRIISPALRDSSGWADLPIEFQPGDYSLPNGSVKIGDNGQVKVSYNDIAAGVAMPHLVEGLFSHLSNSKLPKFAEMVGDKGKLNNFVVKAEQYSQELLEFLKLIADEVTEYKGKVNFHDEALLTFLKDLMEK